MPIGPIVNMFAIIIGGFLGAFFQNSIPERLTKAMPLTFGAASMGMGIYAITKLETLPPVILSLLIGSVFGELIRLEKGIEWCANKVRIPLGNFLSKGQSMKTNDDFMEKFVAIVVLFCASGTGVFGAMNEGIIGDTSLLISKAFLDFFTAAIFATTLGFMIITVAVPQVMVSLTLYFSAGFLLPLTEPFMINDFSAVGGVIMLATGFRIAGIKLFPIANMLPALLIVMPISNLWMILFG